MIVDCNGAEELNVAEEVRINAMTSSHIPACRSSESRLGEIPLDDEYMRYDQQVPGEDFEPLQATLCPPSVRVFSVKMRSWYEVLLDHLEEIQWSSNALASLVLEPETMDLIRTLVERHSLSSNNPAMEVIRGKGEVR